MGNRQIFMRNLHNKLKTEPVGLHRVSITPAIKTYHSLISCVKAGVIGLFLEQLAIYVLLAKISQGIAGQKIFNTGDTEGPVGRRKKLHAMPRSVWENSLGFFLGTLWFRAS